MTGIRIRLGTRGSKLALTQANMVRDALTETLDLGRDRVEIVVFTTRGDVTRDCAIEDIGGRGVFTDELDRAVIDGDIDAAVHSVKDLPATLSSGLRLAATLEREDPREAFVSAKHASLADVPSNGVFGTASVRRASLLRNLRPQARFALLRGNVEERVAALSGPNYDGTILAVAGLKRLGLVHHIRETIDPEILMPDPGQGAIGIVARATDVTTRAQLARVNHAPTWAAVVAERTVLAMAGGQVIVGALATVDGTTLRLRSIAASIEGSILTRSVETGPVDDAVAIGTRAGVALVSHALQEMHA